MSDENEVIRNVLWRTRRTLREAQLALADHESVADPERRTAAFHTVVMKGRAVTFVIQNLRGHADGFDEWYGQWQAQMKADPLMVYMVELRNAIEKRGENQTAKSVIMHNFRPDRDLPPQPKGAIGMVMGDESGGSAWLIEQPDGSTEKQYFSLPPQIVETALLLFRAPDTHMGMPINDRSVGAIARLYVAYLERVVDDAEKTFSVA